MPRDRLFIGYSKQESQVLDELLLHLKPALGEHALVPWTDRDIEPGAKWDPEIRDAIARARVGLVLVSPALLNTPYVVDIELPMLAEAQERGELTLLWLTITPAHVGRVSVRVRSPGRGAVERSLVDLQGLNSPDDGLPADDRERARELVRITGEIARIWRSSARRRPTRVGGDRTALTIALERGDGRLNVKYRAEGDAFFTETSAAAPRWLRTDGASLFDLLFPAREDGRREPLERILDAFGPTGDGGPTSPLGLSLRVRVLAGDAELAAMPWSETTWNGEALVPWWTFESVVDHRSAPLVLDLWGAVRILAFDPDGDLDGAAHGAGLQRHLGKVIGRELPPPELGVGNGRPGREGGTALAYVIGRGRLNDGRLELRTGPKDDPSGWSPIEDVADIHPLPSVLVLLLVGDRDLDGWVPAPWLESPALVLVRVAGPDLGEAFRSVGAWLEDMLHSREPFLDPVELLASPAEGFQRAWTSYSTFSIHRRKAPPARSVDPRKLLDRNDQREKAERLFRDLVEHGQLRSAAAVGYGSPVDHVELLAEQVHQWLLDKASSEAALKWLRIDRGFADPPVAGGLHKLLPRTLHPKGSGDLNRALDHAAPVAAPGRPLRVLFLDWGTVEIGDDGDGAKRWERLRDELEDWARFHDGEIARRCPEDVRVLSLVAVRSHDEIYEDVHRDLDDVLFELRGGATRLELLERLKRVDRHHIFDCLLHLGVEEAKSRELATLLHRAYEGKFEPTAKAMEEAQPFGWEQLLERLRALDHRSER